LAAHSPESAIEQLWDFVGIADRVTDRVGDDVGEVENVFDQAMIDLGRLIAARPDRDPKALAHRVLDVCEGGGFGSSGALIGHLGEALGSAGRAELRRATEAALASLPPPTGEWRAEERHRSLAYRLTILADLEQDTDAYIRAIRAGGMEGTHGIDVAQRLIAAKRPAEALAWLDRPRRHAEYEDSTETDLRIAALEALGRKDEAQALRWGHFERTLSVEHLRAYLKRLPDFEDLYAEQKALCIAAAHKQAALALRFLIAWPALDRADRLVHERITGLDGRAYETLRPAADALEEKYPEAATLLYRRMVESVLDRGSSTQYPLCRAGPALLHAPRHPSAGRSCDREPCDVPRATAEGARAEIRLLGVDESEWPLSRWRSEQHPRLPATIRCVPCWNATGVPCHSTRCAQGFSAISHRPICKCLPSRW
jgi:hypothetical protein